MIIYLTYLSILKALFPKITKKFSAFYYKPTVFFYKMKKFNSKFVNAKKEICSSLIIPLSSSPNGGKKFFATLKLWVVPQVIDCFLPKPGEAAPQISS